ncbi:hypothetical protein GCM10027589_28200 [Actinocorallia lasiicapitis]
MRFAAVLAAQDGAPPPGIDPDAYRLALLEDVYEVIAALEYVRPAVAAPAPLLPLAEQVIWPGTPVLAADSLHEALLGLEKLGATEAVLVAPDVPDLPGLILGKLFRALGSRDVAAAPAQHGLAALAVKLPVPGWLPADVTFDTPLETLRQAGPIFKSPGWHRLRAPEDVALLDPGLEGWDNTRALLS